MSNILEGMARASVDADGCDGDYDKNPHEIREALATDMKRALLWLADNVTDEMVDALANEFHKPGGSTPRLMLAAALRAAAGSALEAKP